MRKSKNTIIARSWFTVKKSCKTGWLPIKVVIKDLMDCTKRTDATVNETAMKETANAGEINLENDPIPCFRTQKRN